jgi:hypothetical protein
MTNDHSTRSSTLVGDINNDGLKDLVVGFPALSTCFVYYGKEKGFDHVLPSFAIYGATQGDEFGWSVAKAGDVNQDSIDDFIICAKATSICYVFFGRTDSFPLEFHVEGMTFADGFRISLGNGNSLSGLFFHFGLSVDFVGDFNKDGWNDLVISAMTMNRQDGSGEGIVFVILGRPPEQLNKDILIEDLYNSNSSSLFIIETPSFSFAGFSIAGVGDINQDGFDDIAIGSIPYQGGYSTQKTYLIYGRALPNNNIQSNNNKNNTLNVGEMIIGKDGFVVIGGGFLVAGVGDANDDGIDDFMVCSYYDWQSKSNAYLVRYPEKNDNFTSPPTRLPSSHPSSHPSFTPSTLPTMMVTSDYPTNHPARRTTVKPFRPLNANESDSPTVTPTPRPSRKTGFPTIKKTISPSKVPTITPSTRGPTHTPTIVSSSVQTTSPSLKKTTVPSATPSKAPYSPTVSLAPSHTTFRAKNVTIYINESAFETIICDGKPESTYLGKNYRNQIFVLSFPGDYLIISRSSNSDLSNDIKNNIVMKFMKVFDILPITKQQVVIEEFDPDTDIINFSKFPNIQSLKDVSYTTNPLKLLLPAVESSSSSDSSNSLLPFLSSHAETTETASSSATSDNQQTITFSDFNDLASLSEETNFRFAVSDLSSGSSSSNSHSGGFSSFAVDSLLSRGSTSSYLMIFCGVMIAVVVLVSCLGFLRADVEYEKKEKDGYDENGNENSKDEEDEDEDEENEREDDEENQLAATSALVVVPSAGERRLKKEKVEEEMTKGRNREHQERFTRKPESIPSSSCSSVSVPGKTVSRKNSSDQHSSAHSSISSVAQKSISDGKEEDEEDEEESDYSRERQEENSTSSSDNDDDDNEEDQEDDQSSSDEDDEEDDDDSYSFQSLET